MDSCKPTQAEIVPCCPICMMDLDGDKQWIAFSSCGHRTCSQCYNELVASSLPAKPYCPICKAVIEDIITLIDKWNFLAQNIKDIQRICLILYAAYITQFESFCGQNIGSKGWISHVSLLSWMNLGFKGAGSVPEHLSPISNQLVIISSFN